VDLNLYTNTEIVTCRKNCYCNNTVLSKICWI